MLDDDEAVLRTFARVLRDHDVVCSASGREALTMIARESELRSPGP